jgi:formylglycine-generating enzyme required for sulfatase activity
VKGDWEQGVPYLALGSDAALKAVALMELRQANSAEHQAAIGNAWWDAAEARQGAERDTLRMRAGFWYRQAEPALAAGLAALKIKQRLEELAKLGREIPMGPRVSRASETPPLAVAPFDEQTAKQHQAAWAKYLKLPLEVTNSIGMQFVLIPPGEFEMGTTEGDVAKLLAEARVENLPDRYIQRLPAEAPKHRVRITKPFYLGLCEVRQAEYARVMGTNPSKFKGDPTCPVDMVSWDEASAFCHKLAELRQEQASRAEYRLPTEAEWEYACRVGTTTTWYSVDDEAALKDSGWYRANSGGKPHPVGQKTPNAWGLYDMHGNVWEWCQDWRVNGYYASSPMDDPAGAPGGSHRVFRGGSWSNVASRCRASYRCGDEPGDRYHDLGFRLARTVSSSPSR